MTTFQTRYFKNEDQKLMFKQIAPLQVVLLQVFGRDLTEEFHHRHEMVTYPSIDRLEIDLKNCVSSSAEEWEDLLNVLLQLNKEKLAFMNIRRQRMFDEGKKLR